MMRMIDDPLSNPAMPLCESQEVVEMTDRGRYAQERPGLFERRHCRADGQPVTADLSAADRLPLERVSAVVATARIERSHPATGGGDVVADLGRVRATKWHFDRIEGIAVGVGTQQRSVVPPASDPGGNVIWGGPPGSHGRRPSRRVRYSSIVIVSTRENVPVGLSTNPIAFTYGSMT